MLYLTALNAVRQGKKQTSYTLPILVVYTPLLFTT
jgi:hypothetical protein